MLGPGHRANAALGRALRLLMINLGGTTPGEVSKSVMGQPSRYTFLFGENEEESPWAPLHVDRGLAPDTSAVTLMGVLGTTNVMSRAVTGPVSARRSATPSPSWATTTC